MYIYTSYFKLLWIYIKSCSHATSSHSYHCNILIYMVIVSSLLLVLKAHHSLLLTVIVHLQCAVLEFLVLMTNEAILRLNRSIILLAFAYDKQVDQNKAPTCVHVLMTVFIPDQKICDKTLLLLFNSLLSHVNSVLILSIFTEFLEVPVLNTELTRLNRHGCQHTCICGR